MALLDMTARRASGILFLLLSGIPGFAAVVSFSDGFEGTTIDPFWTVSQQFGTISLSTEQSFAGSQSAKFSSIGGGQRNMMLSHTFATPMKGTATVQYYDAAPGQETLYQIFSLSTAGLGKASTGAQDFDANCYFASAASSGPNQNCGIYPQLTTTDVARTLGWHELTLTVGAASASVSIDGQLVFQASGDYTFDTVLFVMSGPSWRPDVNTYIDNFSIEAYSSEVPEPHTLALAALGLSGLCWLRRRARRTCE